jgi:ABC-2 type transport system permease protein
VAQPLNSLHICAGFTAFPFAYAVIRATVYVVIAGLWMGLDMGKANWIGLAAVALTAAAALASLGIVAGAAVLVFKRGGLISLTLVFGMTLISGSIFPVSTLPDWVAAAGSVLPLRLAFDGAREALFQGSGAGAEALGLAGFAVVGLPLAVWLFGRALNHTRKTGSLGQY